MMLSPQPCRCASCEQPRPEPLLTLSKTATASTLPASTVPKAYIASGLGTNQELIFCQGGPPVLALQDHTSYRNSSLLERTAYSSYNPILTDWNYNLYHIRPIVSLTHPIPTLGRGKSHPLLCSVRLLGASGLSIGEEYQRGCDSDTPTTFV